MFRPFLIRLVLSSLVLSLMIGCQKYGEVSSGAYDVAMAVYSTCNRKDVARLTVLKTSIQQSFDSEQITSSERNALEDMVQLAEQGEWTEAMQNARTMIAEQVN